ncbi:TonB-dependent Receptor Plug Domain [Catalinimonas alkaloidigena]|uniref:TonB-dependent Receptor Plug Domain n=2 Tax=Catalinimonas alkaloidigena TaxID=1075417 RepID=A0A1G9GWW2_9BACT|nr:TonB-dependent Receptor Plug Domain [Catalinimonas alkaloidigena]
MTVISNEEGFYALMLPEGQYAISCQYVGMEPFVKSFTIRGHDFTLNIRLQDSRTSLDQVEVTATPLTDVNTVQMGATTLAAKVLQKIPTFLGEVDVIRSITTLPGVVTAGEGAAGFQVRGGGADQNLILLDDAPVFNSAHLFGFFSIYNPDYLKSFTLHRSGVSARYGSRISSVLDVSMADGHEDKLHVSTGLSPMTFKLGLDGPLTKRSSFVLAGRGASANHILKLFPSQNLKNSAGYFYDFNVKYHYQIDARNEISLSAYYSKDGFKFPYDTLYHWSNALGSLKWHHILNDNYSGALTLVKSHYQNQVEGIRTGEEFVLQSGVDFTQVKYDGNYFGIPQHTLEFGAGGARYQVEPGDFQTYGTSSRTPITLDQDLGYETYYYLNDEVSISKALSVSMGLRHSFFAKYGPGEVYTYEEGVPRSENTIVDTVLYSSREKIKAYQGLEPRAAVKLSLNAESSVKLGYSRMRQYIQLISNTASITPVDIWKLSNRYLAPQIADQWALGYFFVRDDQAYEFSWEVYYKNLLNQLDYKNGATLSLNPALEAALLTGTGFAYGSEWLIKKNHGRLTGWLSLNYARSFRVVAGPTPEESINNGEVYPSNYDRPLNINLFSSYRLYDPRWSFSFNFTYTTGRPNTIADSWFRYYDTILANYRGRNQERMPDYHRLDIAFNYTSHPHKKVQSRWSFSVYNLYFRKNAYSLLYAHFYGSPVGTYKLSVLGSAIPSLSYQLTF